MFVLVLILFKNTGHYTAYGYIKYIVVSEKQGDYYKTLLRTERDTMLARVIAKYIIRKPFYNTGKRQLKKRLTVKRYNLLKGLCEAGSKYWLLYSKALENKWTTKELEAQLFWRLV